MTREQLNGLISRKSITEAMFAQRMLEKYKEGVALSLII